MKSCGGALEEEDKLLQARRFFPAALSAILIFSGCRFQIALADTPGTQAIYGDAYENGWSFGGWAKSVDAASTEAVHGGKDAIAVAAGPYEALSLRHAVFDTSAYAAISFWLQAPPETKLKLQALRGDKAAPGPEFALAAPAGNKWRHYVVPLAALGADKKPDMVGFWIQDASGTGAHFQVDDVALVSALTGDGQADDGVPPPPQALLPVVAVTVDAALNRHAISPDIYGMNFAGPEHALLHVPLNRDGGDTESRYNWKENAHAIGNDYFFESVPVGDPVPGKQADNFVAASKAIGAQPMITIPLIGWVAKLGPNREKLASFSVAKYGPQKETNTQEMPDAGKGVRPDGSVITNDPNDANVPADPAFMRGWVEHLVAKWGPASKGGVRYYLMDNEPNIWSLTHRDVDPHGIGMDEYRDRLFAYAAMVKSVDPSALVIGPECWDFNGSKYSDADIYQASHGGSWNVMPDRKAHGGEDFFPWILDQLRAHDLKTGKKLVDVASFHYYPQKGLSDDVSPAQELDRNRNTRSLWDPHYKAESWVNDTIDMLPRMKAFVAGHYPGLKLAYTEYNWGADQFINGATAQADVLGIIGREGGIDMATRFSAPDAGTPVFHAFAMYRNYDGHGGAFGSISVSDMVPNPDNLASFASVRRADGALTIMVISKVLTGQTPLSLTVRHFALSSPVQVWQLTSRNVITRLPDTRCLAGQLSLTLPAQSISLLVVPASKQPAK